MLPTNNKELSVDGVLLLAQMGEEYIERSDPAAAHQKVLDRQRQELEDILECYHGVLTSAQMGQYQATLLEQRDLMNRMPRNPPAEETPHVQPQTQEPVAPEVIEDDEYAGEGDEE